MDFPRLPIDYGQPHRGGRLDHERQDLIDPREDQP